jgi:hypothetical protein
VLVDAKGRPARGARVTVARPAGPLAERLWPGAFTADGAGALLLPPLEAGEHRVTAGRAKGHNLTVPRLSDRPGKRPATRIVVE